MCFAANFCNSLQNKVPFDCLEHERGERAFSLRRNPCRCLGRPKHCWPLRYPTESRTAQDEINNSTAEAFWWKCG
jgi:hypothetical protein